MSGFNGVFERNYSGSDPTKLAIKDGTHKINDTYNSIVKGMMGRDDLSPEARSTILMSIVMTFVSNMITGLLINKVPPHDHEELTNSFTSDLNKAIKDLTKLAIALDGNMTSTLN